MANDLDPRSGKRTVEIPFRWLVKKNDADFDKDRSFEPEYEFGGGRRTFKAKTNNRGAYTQDPPAAAPAAPQAAAPAPEPTTIQTWSHNLEGGNVTAWYGTPANGAFENNKITGQSTPGGGAIIYDSTTVQSGSGAARFTTPAKTTATVPKAHITRDGFLCSHGRLFTTEAHVRIDSGQASYDNCFLADYEVNGTNVHAMFAGNFFGIRFALNAARAIKVDREFSDDPDPTDFGGRSIAFPLDSYVHLKIHVYAHGTNGYVKVWINGTLAFEAYDFQTIPTGSSILAKYGVVVLAEPVYSDFQIGITANGNDTYGYTMRVDTVSCSVIQPVA